MVNVAHSLSSVNAAIFSVFINCIGYIFSEHEVLVWCDPMITACKRKEQNITIVLYHVMNIRVQYHW